MSQQITTLTIFIYASSNKSDVEYSLCENI
jgi:hypothetical protein